MARCIASKQLHLHLRSYDAVTIRCNLPSAFRVVLKHGPSTQLTCRHYCFVMRANRSQKDTKAVDMRARLATTVPTKTTLWFASLICFGFHCFRFFCVLSSGSLYLLLPQSNETTAKIGDISCFSSLGVNTSFNRPISVHLNYHGPNKTVHTTRDSLLSLVYNPILLYSSVYRKARIVSLTMRDSCNRASIMGLLCGHILYEKNSVPGGRWLLLYNISRSNWNAVAEGTTQNPEHNNRSYSCCFSAMQQDIMSTP